ncbi:hypothetical protein CBS101457_002793 [Exobasidium rhododendri]|nr:hypothetical protein CBS101457_002793 [Exobasidium rhododendri]
MGRPTQKRPGSRVSNASALGVDSELKTIKEVLDNIFAEIFGSPLLPSNAFSMALQIYMREQAPTLQYGEEEMKEQRPCPAVVYDALMPLIVKDLIKACKHKFSRLGQAEQKLSSYLAVSLARDESVHFSSSVQSAESDVSLGDDEFLQLANTWSKVHPLAHCISINFASSRGSAISKALRAIIASEGLTMTRAGDGQRSKLLLKEAQRYFGDAQLSSVGYRQTILHTCQVSTLLSWNSIAHTRAREGVTYLALSCQLMSQLQSDITSLRLEEQTLLENLGAVLSLITVWTFSQLNQSSGYLTGNTIPESHPESQSDQAVLFASFSQMTSLVLDSYPDFFYQLNGETNSSSQDIDFICLCDRLRQALVATTPVSVESGLKGSQLLAAAVRENLIMVLLVPRTIQDPLLFISRVESLLFRCTSAIKLLAHLANIPEDTHTNPHLLRKLTFSHTTSTASVEPHEIPWRSTLASTLFETLSEATEAMSNVMSANQGSLTLRLLDFTQKLLTTPMALVVETPSIGQARARLTSCKDNLQSITKQEAISYQGAGEYTPDMSTDMPSEWDAIVDTDLFDSLWGQLQWSFQ